MHRLLIVAVLLSWAGAASAEPMRMYCKFAKSKGWLTEQFFFDVDAAGKATVVDPIVLHYEGKPIEAKVVENNGKRLTMIWNVVMRNKRGQVTRMAYRAAYLKGNGRISMTAKPSGYDNSFNGRGNCQRTVNPLPTT